MSSLHTVLVIAFVSVTALLLGVTIMHRMRIRNVRMTWRSGRVGSIPIWPVVFMGIVAIFLVYAGNTFPVISLDVFGGYMVGGLLWFSAVVLSSTVVITDYGLIPEVGRTGEAVGWGQVQDYFEVDTEKRTHFVFIYTDFIGDRQRLELSVPRTHVERFRRILRDKLDARIESPRTESAGRKALKN